MKGKIIIENKKETTSMIYLSVTVTCMSLETIKYKDLQICRFKLCLFSASIGVVWAKIARTSIEH